MDKLTITIGYWASLKQPLSDIRTKVFIREQGIPPELEWETADNHCIHALARWQGQAVGTGRLLEDGTIGRLAVLPEWRHRGIASAILERLIAIASERGNRIQLHAQVHALAFYQRFGFHAIGDVFDEAGIKHQTMLLLHKE